MASLIREAYHHPRNKSGEGGQRLFDRNSGLIYSDFISKDSGHRIIADAKYKPLSNIAGRDYLQLLAYMFRFDAKEGYYLYPEAGDGGDVALRMNRGSTFEKNVAARDDVCVRKLGFKIPTGVDAYAAFAARMAVSESEFRQVLLE